MTRIGITALLLGALISLSGQGVTKFNVHLDPQFDWFSSDEGNIQNDGSIFQLQYGLQMDRYFEKNYAFILGFGVNNLGGNLHYTDPSMFLSKGDTLYFAPGQTVKHKLRYLELPIGLKLKTEELGYGTFFLQIGFNPMFNISATATSEDDIYNNENLRESINIFNLGYHAGIGIEYRLGGSTAVIGGIRWSSGLTDVTKYDDANVTVKAISIHMGIQF